MFSRILGVLLFVLLSPLLILVSIIIYFGDGPPIIFKQRRVGINNSEFYVYKFRTMKNGIPDIPTHLMNSRGSLFTKSGPLFRRLSLDELPQLLNIIFGEMVFVGPRPALYNRDDLIELRTKVGVHKLIPGVTGWAQINGRDELEIPLKVQYDEYYLRHRSLLLDIRIIALTIHRVARMRDVSH